MDIKQIRLSPMDTFCYVIGDPSSKTCALIDPAFETNKVLNIVKSMGYRIAHLINTHNHSDHTAGNADIITATGAKLYIHKQDAAGLGMGSPEADVLLEDQSVITIGETTLKVLHTPGHTPGGICLYTPGNIFTGDTLFVGAVGRTDLSGGSAAQLLNSIRTKIYTLPDDTIVWPGHDYGPSPYSTVEHEKRTNLFTI